MSKSESSKRTGSEMYYRTVKQQDAIDREVARSLRSPEQQLDHLDEILGKGVGAVKERARLQKKVQS